MEHLFVISYDISEPKRWRRVFKIMKGYPPIEFSEARVPRPH